MQVNFSVVDKPPPKLILTTLILRLDTAAVPTYLHSNSTRVYCLSVVSSLAQPLRVPVFHSTQRPRDLELRSHMPANTDQA